MLGGPGGESGMKKFEARFSTVKKLGLAFADLKIVRPLGKIQVFQSNS